MKLDEIQDIEVLRNLLKELMCKCIKEVEFKNHADRTVKTVVGEWYYFDYNDEYDEYEVYNGKGYHTTLIGWERKDYKYINDYFEIEGDDD